MKKKLFLIVSIFTMFLIGSSAKADTNKVYWNITGGDIESSTFNVKVAIEEPLADSFTNDPDFYGGVAYTSTELYCSDNDNLEEKEYSSKEECMNAELRQFSINHLWIEKINFINSTSYNPTEKAADYIIVDLSKNQDETVLGYLYLLGTPSEETADYTVDHRGYFNELDIVYDGKLYFNSNSSGIFNLGTLKEINGLENVDTSNVTNMSGMFTTNQLTTLDLSSFDTSNVTDMSYMFANNKLTSINLSSFNTSKVTNMSAMFAANKLTTLNVSSFDTRNVTSMSYMFGDNNLISLDLSNFNTSKVTSMVNMFGNNDLETLNISSFDTSNVTDMSYMFSNNNLEELNVSNFNTSKVTDMTYMFANNNLTTLDLSNFDTSKVTEMSCMFIGLPDITTIYVGSGFTTKNIANTNEYIMFYSTPNLIGEKGTKYNDENDIYKMASYAKIDEIGKPGYFSVKEENKLSNYSISSVGNQNSSGKAITPIVTVKNNSKTLVKDKDYKVTYTNNINPGTATIIVTGINNYVGNLTTTFKINPINISGASLSTIGNQVYNRKAITPGIKVTYSGKTLVNGTDYTVAYKNNVNTGLATITVTGKGNYTGTKSTTFNILPTKVSNLHVTSETQGSIYFAWNKAPGNVTGYSVYKYNVSKKLKTYIGDTKNTTYGMKRLATATTYQYRVVPFTTINGKKYYGSEVILTATTKTVKPSIKLSSKSKKVTIKWKKVKGSYGYEVYMSTKKNSGYKKIKTTTAKSFTKTKLKKGKKYFFKVRTYRTINGKKVYSYYSAIKSIKVK